MTVVEAPFPLHKYSVTLNSIPLVLASDYLLYQLKMASNHSVNGYPTTSFGPTVPERFDFTPLFEDTLLSIVPSALLLLVLPARLFFLRDQPRKVLRSSLHSQKLVCFSEIIALQTRC